MRRILSRSILSAETRLAFSNTHKARADRSRTCTFNEAVIALLWS